MFISKRAVMPLLASGGVAAALFGGAAVHTAFTSSGSSTLNASTATIGTHVSGTVSIANAVPGDLGPVQNVTITNSGSTPETLAVQVAPTTGEDNATLDPYVDVFVSPVGGTPSYVGTLAQLESETKTPVSLNKTVGPDAQAKYVVQLGLSKTATDAEAGLKTSATFTITGTATTDTASGNTGGNTH